MVEFVVWDHVMGVRFSPPRPIDVGVCRMARRRIANPYNAGSSPVTYSNCKQKWCCHRATLYKKVVDKKPELSYTLFID